MNPLKPIFELRDIAHYRHLYTDSFAEHKALNGFYDEILALGDSLLETYQGVYGRITGDVIISLPDPAGVNFSAILTSYKTVFERMRTEQEGKPSIVNIIDDICTLIDSTIYLLTLK